MRPDATLHGHIGMINDYADTFIPPLLLLGKDINTDEPEVLKAAFEMLKAQLASVLTYDYAITFLQTEDGQDLYLTMAYSGDQHILNEHSKGNSWAYTVPEEGTAIWIDCLAIPSNSPAPALARHFINFLNEPKNAVLNAESLGVATANKAARQLLASEMRDDPAIYPTAGNTGSDRLQGYRDVSGESLYLRKRITRALVKLHEAQ